MKVITTTINIFAVSVGFQENSTILLVSEDDGSVTFTLDINGPVDPTSITTVHLTVLSGTAGEVIDMYAYYNLLIILLPSNCNYV